MQVMCNRVWVNCAVFVCCLSGTLQNEDGCVGDCSKRYRYCVDFVNPHFRWLLKAASPVECSLRLSAAGVFWRVERHNTGILLQPSAEGALWVRQLG